MARTQSENSEKASPSPVLPQNVHIEEALLSAILRENQFLHEVAESLRPDDFYDAANRMIFEVASELFAKNIKPDFLTISELLAERGELEDVGGEIYISWLADEVPMAANPEYYAKIVRDKACQRNLIRKASEIAEKCRQGGEGGIEELLDFAERSILELSENRVVQAFHSIKDLVDPALKLINARRENKGVVTGVSTGFGKFDEMTAGLQPSDLVIIAARPSMGKCCTASTEILLSDGSVATLEEICRQGQAELLTLNDDLGFDLTRPSDFIDDGRKPVFRVTTRLGRCVETTLPHPFLTIRGWKPLGELNVGDRIAVPRKLEVFGTEAMRECEIKLLAYLIGDGNLTHATPRFTNRNPRILADFVKAAKEFGGLKAGLENAGLSSWLQQLGLQGKTSHDKFVPPPIFKLPRPLLALFLNRLFATDKSGPARNDDHRQPSYRNASEKLIRQMQHLLLRFGIIAKIGKPHPTDGGQGRSEWQLEIADADSIRVFIKNIGIFGKEGVIGEAKIAIEPELLESDGESARGEVLWDEIVSIVPAGNQQVYDLTIPETHNFVANDICVHNTAFALNVAANAAREDGTPVAVFSLEMSKEQLVMRMLCSEAGVSSSSVRTGFLSTEDWERMEEAGKRLGKWPIFIDDSANISDMEIRAKARRLKKSNNIGLIIIDYLQLMKTRISAERRDLEIAEISRGLKALSKELDIPVVALSQLNRKLEERGDKRPLLSDLRESGCLAGDTLVPLASGRRVPIKTLVGRKNGIEVFALNEKNHKTEKAKTSNAFSTGIKPVYLMTTASGRSIKATRNHKFRTIDGWKRLDQLEPGEHIAVPRESDIYWDKIRSIAYDGEEETFDLTIPLYHNFVANNLYVHNSLEQDSDVVAFIYRDEVYNKDDQNPNRGIAEIIIAKQRNGPVGAVKLAFLNQFTRFENLSLDYHGG